MSGRRLSRAYAGFVRMVSQGLYDFDPDGIGSSIDAPLDEYDDLAQRLASNLVAADSAQEVGEITRSIFSNADEGLIEHLWSALRAYRASPGPDA